jgi:hypothetical protein
MTMKPNTIASLLLCLLLCSCSSDKGGSDEQISDAQLNAIVGTWTLVGYNVSPAQDANNDGTASENMLEELECLSGSIVFTKEFKWTRTTVQLGSAPITGGSMGFFCTTPATKSGSWSYLEGDIYLSEGSDGIYNLNGNTLTLEVGDVLPGVDSYVYQKP